MLLPINIKAEKHEKKITTRVYTPLCLNISYFLQPNYLRLPLKPNSLVHQYTTTRFRKRQMWHMQDLTPYVSLPQY